MDRKINFKVKSSVKYLLLHELKSNSFVCSYANKQRYKYIETLYSLRV